MLLQPTIAAAIFASLLPTAIARPNTKYSPDGTCGLAGADAIPRYGYSCLPAKGGCCSQYGWCGSSTDFCGNGCQSEYGRCNSAKPKFNSTRPQSAAPTDGRTPLPSYTKPGGGKVDTPTAGSEGDDEKYYDYTSSPGSPAAPSQPKAPSTQPQTYPHPNAEVQDDNDDYQSSPDSASSSPSEPGLDASGDHGYDTHYTSSHGYPHSKPEGDNPPGGNGKSNNPPSTANQPYDSDDDSYVSHPSSSPGTPAAAEDDWNANWDANDDDDCDEDGWDADDNKY